MKTIVLPIDSRANVTRAITVAEAIAEHPDLDLYLVAIGPLATTWQSALPAGLKPNSVIASAPLTDSPWSATAAYCDIISGLSDVIRQVHPDTGIALTDRYESLAVATTYSMLNVPIAHIQGGELSGTIDEGIRHAISKLAHLHFVATDEAVNVVRMLGEAGSSIFNVGCPATDLLLRVDVSKRLCEEPYILVLMHPVWQEHASAQVQMNEVLAGAQAAADGRRVIVVGPNHDAGSHGIWAAIKTAGIAAPHTVPFDSYVNLMAHADAFVTNSSSGIRESCYFGTPTINVGSRQQGRRPRGRAVLDSAPVQSEIARVLDAQLAAGPWARQDLYGNGTAGKQIAELLATIEPDLQKRFYV